MSDEAKISATFTSAQKEFVFDAAHRLPNYSGACANIHGHTYRVLVEIIIPAHMRKNPFVVDFKTLDTEMKKVLQDWDHHLLLYVDDPMSKILDQMPLFASSLLLLPFIPSAENMAQHITKELMSRFTGDRVKIGNKAYQSLFDLSVYSKSKIATSFTLKVSVYETPTSVASHYLHYDMDSTT